MRFVELTLTDGKPFLLAVDMIAAVSGETPKVSDRGDFFDVGCSIYLRSPLRSPGNHDDLWIIPAKESYSEACKMLEAPA